MMGEKYQMQYEDDGKYNNNNNQVGGLGYEVQGYPLAPATLIPRSDQVSAPPLPPNEEFCRHPNAKRKRIQCVAIIFSLLLILIVIVLLIVFITRVTTPAVYLGDAVVTRGGDSLRLTVRLHIRNSNFGHYDFDGTTVTVRLSGNDDVSHFQIPDSRVRARSTKKISVTADLGSPSSSGMESDSDSDTVEFRLKGELKGKVEVLNVIKRNKTAELDCRIRVRPSTHEVRDLRCD